MVQLATCLLCKLEKESLEPRTHINVGHAWHFPCNPALRRQREEIPRTIWHDRLAKPTFLIQL